MKNDQARSKIDRRKLLKTAGVAAAGTSLFPAIGSAKENPSENKLYRAARRVREKTGSNEKFRRKLEKQGAKTAMKDLQFQAPWTAPPAENDGEISTQEIDMADTTLQMTMTIYTGPGNSGYPYVDLYWEHDITYSSGESLPAVPDDIVGLTYEERDYDLVDESWYGGNSTDKRRTDNAGVAFNYTEAACREFEDAGVKCEPFGESFTIYDYCGMQVIPDETEDASLRQVYADYWHTYEQTTIQSVSISSAGDVSVTLIACCTISRLIQTHRSAITISRISQFF